MADELYSVYQQYAPRGLPPDALRVIAEIESGHNPRAQNPHSSAGGLFQFTDNTAEAYGLTGNTRFDPARATEAAAQLALDNARYLEAHLGRPPTVGELYLAHQQGMGGARALLANPDRNVIDALTPLYGSRAKAQEVVRLNGGKATQTAGQFANRWISKAEAIQKRIPPGEIPNTVATAMDVVPPRSAPTPVTPTPSMNTARQPGMQDALAALRAAQMSGAAPDVYRGIFAPAAVAQPPARDIASLAALYAGGGPTRPTAPRPMAPAPLSLSDMVSGDGITRSVEAASSAQDPALASALAQLVARRTAPAMPTGVAQSYAGQDGGTKRPMSIASSPMSYAGQEGAPRLNIRRPVPSMPTSIAQSYAGQEGFTPKVASAPTPASQSDNLLIRRTPASAGQVIATIPTTPSSGVGQSPATRVVQSVPVTPKPAPTPAPKPNLSIATAYTGGDPWLVSEGPKTSNAQIPKKATPPMPGTPTNVPGINRIPGLAGTVQLPPDVRPNVPPIVKPTPTTVAKTTTVPPDLKKNPLSRDSVAQAASAAKSIAAINAKPLVGSTVPGPNELPKNDTLRLAPNMGPSKDMSIGYVSTLPPVMINPAVGVATALDVGNVPLPRPRPQRQVAALPPVVPVAAQPPRPVAPVPRSIVQPPPERNALLSLVGGNAIGSLIDLLSNQNRQAPVGAFLGIAPNGGAMIQGANGIMNSISQESDWWKQATGQSYGSSSGGASSLSSMS